MDVIERLRKNWLFFRGLLDRSKDGQAIRGSNDVVILIMGPTGVGKSTFIKEYTQSPKVLVGHGMESCTLDVTPYDARVPDKYTSNMEGRRLILVDTPGFDHEFIDDAETLQRIAAWIKRSRQTDGTIAGLVYLSDITQDTTMASWKTINQEFSKLSSVNSSSKVVLATTQWDKFRDESYGNRQQERMTAMQEGGVKVMHIRQKPNDQQAIVEYLLGNFFYQPPPTPKLRSYDVNGSQVYQQQPERRSVTTGTGSEMGRQGWGSRDNRYHGGRGDNYR